MITRFSVLMNDYFGIGVTSRQPPLGALIQEAGFTPYYRFVDLERLALPMFVRRIQEKDLKKCNSEKEIEFEKGSQVVKIAWFRNSSVLRAVAGRRMHSVSQTLDSMLYFPGFPTFVMSQRLSSTKINIHFGVSSSGMAKSHEARRLS
jgi:hypothetical protein